MESVVGTIGALQSNDADFSKKMATCKSMVEDQANCIPYKLQFATDWILSNLHASLINPTRNLLSQEDHVQLGILFSKVLHAAEISNEKLYFKSHLCEVLTLALIGSQIALSDLITISDYCLKHEHALKILTCRFKQFTLFVSAQLKRFQHMDKSGADLMDLYLQLMNSMTKVLKKLFISHHNLGQVFLVFCECMLEPILGTHTLLVEESLFLSPDVCRDLVDSLDDITKLALCCRDSIQSLKPYLAKASSSECPPNKRHKPDRGFDVFFKCLSSAIIHLQSNEGPVKAAAFKKQVSRIYRSLVLACRNNKFLTHSEEFMLMQKFVSTLNVVMDNTYDVACMHSFLEVVKDLSVYQHVADSACNFVMQRWLENVVDQVLLLLLKDSAVELSGLSLLLCVLQINHVALDTSLESLWSCCLCGETNSSDEARGNLLCELLRIYNRLHQLPKFVRSFAISKSVKCPVNFPGRFEMLYRQFAAELPMSAVNELVDLFYGAIEDICNDICSDHALVHHLEVVCLLWYLLVTSAQILPLNGYKNEELTQFTAKVLSLQNILRDAALPATREYGLPVKQIMLLLTHAVANVYMLLYKANLASPEDVLLAVNLDIDWETEIEDLNQEHAPRLFYAKLLVAVDCIKYDQQFGTRKGSLLPSKLLFDLNYMSESCLMPWKMNYGQITPSNIGTAHLHVLFSNMALIQEMPSDDIKMLANFLWIKCLSCKSVEDMFRISLQDMSSFSNFVFQDGLLDAAVCELANLIPPLQSAMALKSESKLEDILKSLIVQCSLTGRFKFKKKSEQAQQVIKKLEILPLELLSEGCLCVVMGLGMILLISLKTLSEFSARLRSLLGDALEVVLVRNLSVAGRFFPVSLFLDEFLQWFATQDSPSPKVLKILSNLSKVMIKYTPKDLETVSATSQKVSDLLVEENYQTGFTLLSTMLDSMLKLLSEPTLWPRTQYNVSLFVKSSVEALCAFVVQRPSLSDDPARRTFLGCFTCICSILQLEQGGRNELSACRDAISSNFQRICAAAGVEESAGLEEASRCDLAKETLQFWHMLYSSSSPDAFVSCLRAMYPGSPVQVLNSVLKALDRNCDHLDTVYEVVTRLVPHMENKVEALEILFGCLKASAQEAGSHVVLLNLWRRVLAVRLDGDSRHALMFALPKVMLHCLHSLSLEQVQDDVQIIALLKLLVAVATVSKHSSLSQYMVALLHALVDVRHRRKTFNSFEEVFEESYQILSILLFHHTPVVYSAIAAYLSCLHGLLFDLVDYNEVLKSSTAPSSSSSRSLAACCDRLSRLYAELASHKTTIQKYSPYIISNYIRAVQQTTFTPDTQAVLDTGIHKIMDTCSNFEFTLLGRVLESSEKERYRWLRTSYDEHKFKGKT